MLPSRKASRLRAGLAIRSHRGLGYRAQAPRRPPPGCRVDADRDLPDPTLTRRQRSASPASCRLRQRLSAGDPGPATIERPPLQAGDRGVVFSSTAPTSRAKGIQTTDYAHYWSNVATSDNTVASRTRSLSANKLRIYYAHRRLSKTSNFIREQNRIRFS